MEQEHKSQKKAAYPAQVTVLLRLAAGGYLLYLSYGLIPDILASSGGRRIIQAAFVLIFVTVGVLLFGWSAKKLIKGEFIRPGQLPDEGESPPHLRSAESGESPPHLRSAESGESPPHLRSAERDDSEEQENKI